MSLINKVLTDLDQRGVVNGSPNANMEGESALNDLPFAHVPQRKNNRYLYGIVASVVILLMVSGVAGFYLFLNNGTNKENDVSTSTTLETQSRNPASNESVPTQIKQTLKPVNTVKQDVAVRRSQPKVLSQPVIEANVRKQTKTAINKGQKARPEIANMDTNLNFSKNVVPMRSEQRAEVAYQSAYDYLKARNIHKAERSLRQALAVEPGHIKARELLSGVYIKQGRWVEASELLRDGLSISPGHRTFSKLYARALMQLKQDKRAIKVLLQHAPAIKNDPEYYAILAALYQRQQDHVSAARTYQKIVEVEPRSGVWWVGLGISLEALGESQQASQAYDQARKSGNLQQDIAHFTNNRLVALDAIGYPAQ